VKCKREKEIVIIELIEKRIHCTAYKEKNSNGLHKV
jgi:hypothetical protein